MTTPNPALHQRRHHRYRPHRRAGQVKSRREAKDWCQTHYPGSPINEIGADAARRGDSKVTRDNPAAKMVLSPDDPMAKAYKNTARVKK